MLYTGVEYWLALKVKKTHKHTQDTFINRTVENNSRDETYEEEREQEKGGYLLKYTQGKRVGVR